jgi:bifunctional DNase/RNase
MVKHLLIPLSFHKIIQARSYTVIILASPTKKIAIYTEAATGKLLQMHLTDSEKIRPMTHDLIRMILRGLQAKVMRVVIHDLQENVYFAKVFLQQKNRPETGEAGSSEPPQGFLSETIVEIDSRPSDAIALAILSQAPLFCSHEVHEKALHIEDQA